MSKRLILEPTYEQYCRVLDSVETAGVLNFIVPPALTKIAGEIRVVFSTIVEETGASIRDLVRAVKTRSFYGLMRSVGFSFVKLFKAVNAISSAVRRGLLKLFSHLAASGVFQKLQSGAVTVDAVLAQYPLLKRISGPLMAGLLLYMWMNMSFIGDAQFDLDLSHIGAAFVGSFSIADLLASPQGLMGLSLMFAGVFTGISFPWLAESSYNLILGVVYTLARTHAIQSLASRLKTRITKVPVKVHAFNDTESVPATLKRIAKWLNVEDLDEAKRREHYSLSVCHVQVALAARKRLIKSDRVVLLGDPRKVYHSLLVDSSGRLVFDSFNGTFDLEHGTYRVFDTRRQADLVWKVVVEQPVGKLMEQL